MKDETRPSFRQINTYFSIIIIINEWTSKVINFLYTVSKDDEDCCDDREDDVDCETEENDE